MEPTSPNLIALAADFYVTICLMAAAVRWFHMCRPYANKPLYYYPGRPFVTGAWLCALALLPYVFHPEDPDAWFLARLYFLPVVMYHFALILSSYFGCVMQWKKWRMPMLLSGVPVALALLAAVVLAIWPGVQMGGTRLASFVLYVLGVLVTALCITFIVVVYAWARRFDPDDFSNPADFPVTQAWKWVVIILVNLVFCWTGALLDNPAALAVIQLFIGVSCVLFLITALHPHRNRPLEDPAKEADEAAAHAYPAVLPMKKQKEILSAIRMVVEERKGFLDPHLTLQDIAHDCGYNRTYISAIIKREFGGFVDYVSRLRLAYMDDFLKQNPDATIVAAIDVAGFGSRSRYYEIKSKYQGK